MLRASAAPPEVFCLVAREADEIVGFTVCQITRDPLLPGVGGEVHELYVVPHARGAGVSRHLADSALALLRRLGAGPVWSTCAATIDRRTTSGRPSASRATRRGSHSTSD